ncbi:MAG: thiamine diphosphokinase [Candidatus Marinimicrobia bacterium]|nr:thiamine diphosphokinase [Candidatus Neomarinimicrobiota bacterium]
MSLLFPLTSQTPYYVILGNGNYPSRQLTNTLLLSADKVICADGGANYAFRNNISPYLIVGDLDSIAPEAHDYFKKNHVPIRKINSQQENDLEKTLREVNKMSCEQIVMLGFMGKRDDQSIVTLQIAKKFIKNYQIIIYSTVSEILLLQPGSYSLKSLPRSQISLLGFPRAHEVSTTGLKWNLNHEILSEGSRGISNRAETDEIRIRFTKGLLLIIRDLSAV